MSVDIMSIKRKMLIKYPFFGSIVANVEYVNNENIPTAATDGKKIYYNKKFLDSLSVDEQIFLFAHEVCHIAFNHILRSDGKDPYIWNLATDAVINAFLKKDGLKIIVGGVEMDNAINYDAEELYEKLLNEEQQHGQLKSESGSSSKQNIDGGKGSHKSSANNSEFDDSKHSTNKNKNSSSNSSDEGKENESRKNDVGHDTHSMWEDAVKKENSNNEKKDSLLDRMLNKNKDNNEGQNSVESEIKNKISDIKELGEKETFKKNAEEKKENLNRLKRSLTQETISVGKNTNSNVRKVSEIGNAKKLLDWRYLLKEAVKYDVDWSYSNATIEDGVITPNLEEIPKPETEIILDTSGSISESLLRNFLRECKNILKESKVKVGCVDSIFYGFKEIKTEDDIDNMEFVGGGGNDFEVVVNSFSKRVENKIYFTDGYAEMPTTPLDVIWVVFGDKKINPKGGKVIYIDEAELNKMYSYESSSKVR